MDEQEKEGQKAASVEAPKNIEDLLKDLPKLESPQKPASPPPPPPQIPKPSSPLSIPPSTPPRSTGLPPPPKPTSPPSPPPSDDKLKTLVRTMEQDIEAAKKGLKPEGKPLELKTGPSPLPGPAAPPSPKASEGTAASEIKLGPPEKARLLTPERSDGGQARPLELTPLPKPPPVTLKPSPVKPVAPRTQPRRFLLNKGVLIALILAALVIAGLIFFSTREREIVQVTQLITKTPTPLPPSIRNLVGSPSTITIASTENFLNSLNDAVKTFSLLGGTFSPLEIFDENQSKYSLSQIFEKLQIEPPIGFLESLDPQEWTLFVFAQQEMFDQKGQLIISPAGSEASPKPRFGLIAKVNNASALRTSLNVWETTISQDFKNFFNLDLKKATSETFLDNIYKDTAIRYRNFPFADNTIDYSIISLADFDASYLGLTSSREGLYRLIDLIQ